MNIVSDITMPELVTETKSESEAIRVRMVGSAETDASDALGAFLNELHTKAMGRVEEVVIDLRSLEFMNSSCFKKFVSWVGVLQDEAPPSQYHVRFLWDENKHWQGRSLGALAGFAVDLVHLESV